MARWGQVWVAGCAVIAFGLLCAFSGTAARSCASKGMRRRCASSRTRRRYGDVLAALKAKFRLRYRAIDSDRQVSGTISGTLHRVVVRLLDGHDFVVQRSADGVEIIQIAPRGGATALRVGRPIAPVWRTSLKQVSTSVPR